MREYDVVVIGGGAAGSEAAGAAVHAGASVLLAEARHFGGTCTNEGCVPTKALVRAARIAHDARNAARYGISAGPVGVDWPAVIGRARAVRDHMLRFGAQPFLDAGVDVRFPAAARLAGSHLVEIEGETVGARTVVLATGLVPAVPPIPGLRESAHLDNESALALDRLPGSLAVIGSGPIGVEFAQVFSRLGVRVTVLEVAPRALPVEEPESGAAIAAALRAEGVDVRVGVQIERVERTGGTSVIDLGGGQTVSVEAVLVATGRRLEGEALGLDTPGLGIEWSARGVGVDGSLRTACPWIFAAGDVCGGPLFTHAASEMGVVAARNAVRVARGEGGLETVRLDIVPRVTFTDPEAASVGLTEEAARAAGHDVRVGFARMAESEKGEIDGRDDPESAGHVKVVADAASGRLLGCAVVGETAGDMIHEAVAIMAAGEGALAKAARALHAYPTYSEVMRSALREAAGL